VLMIITRRGATFACMASRERGRPTKIPIWGRPASPRLAPRRGRGRGCKTGTPAPMAAPVRSTDLPPPPPWARGSCQILSLHGQIRDSRGALHA
jgi:hypothetical protein